MAKSKGYPKQQAKNPTPGPGRATKPPVKTAANPPQQARYHNTPSNHAQNILNRAVSGRGNLSGPRDNFDINV